MTRGSQRVAASHAEWFSVPETWTFDYEVVATRERDNWALALLHVTYRHTPDSQPSRFFLSLVFERGDDGAFRLAYDQNTPLG